MPSGFRGVGWGSGYGAAASRLAGAALCWVLLTIAPRAIATPGRYAMLPGALAFGALRWLEPNKGCWVMLAGYLLPRLPPSFSSACDCPSATGTFDAATSLPIMNTALIDFVELSILTWRECSVR